MQQLKLPFFLTLITVLLVPIIMYVIVGENKVQIPDADRQEIFDMQISLYRKDAGKVETLSAYDYIRGVVAAEMSCDFEKEALKAQAVAAFTYMVNKMNYEPSSEHDGAYMCDDYNHCKAYMPINDAKKKLGGGFNNITDAVFSTFGQTVTYNGTPINAVFHSTSCGMTASALEVWGSDIPYLQSVECASDMSQKNYETKVIISKKEFANTFYEQLGVRLDGDDWIGNISYYPSGYVEKIIIDGTEYDGTYIRSLFSLRSAAFDVSLSGDNVVFIVRGYGHGCGMSQNGANSMAKNGSDYKQILSHFYKDTELSDYKI